MPVRIDPMVGPGGVREVTERWVIVGDLVLESAAHLGNGEVGESVDMPLLRDRIENVPLLAGASLAGALRNHVDDWLGNYGVSVRTDAERLFGGDRGDDDGHQSPLIVFDSLAKTVLPSELRDGVSIDAASGTAARHLKFDCEVLQPGTEFPLRFEVLVGRSEDRNRLLTLLTIALAGLESGEIPIGARKNRGLGVCRVRQWAVRRFDLSRIDGWWDWLKSDHESPLNAGCPKYEHVADALLAADTQLLLSQGTDQRRRAVVNVSLQFEGGLLIRSPGTQADSPDVVHLRSGNNSILSGTSLAGALRARAARIARVVRQAENDGLAWVSRLFGSRELERASGQSVRRNSLIASRLRMSERNVTESRALRPARIRIDRFTGGVVDGALFDEEPVYGGRVKIQLEIRDPQVGELGLLLLVLKDLLTGDLNLGGSGSVGRGVASGTAVVCLPGEGEKGILTFNPNLTADPITAGRLNAEVQAFHSAPVILSLEPVISLSSEQRRQENSTARPNR